MVDSGVPQGSVLGPILFLIYVDDAARDLDCEVAMLADDMKIWSVIRGAADEDRLQMNLNRLEEWSNRWLLRFNVAKYSILRLGNTVRFASIRGHFLGGAALQEVEAQRDLGVLTASSLKPSAHCSRVAKSAMSVLASFYRSRRQLQQRLREMQDAWTARKAEEIQGYADRNEWTNFFSAIKAVYGPPTKGTAPLLSADGNTLLTEKTQILQRWAEHFRGVLNRPSVISDAAIERLPQVETSVDLDLPPSLQETIRAVQQLSSGKAPGSDAIPAEVYKHGGPQLIDRLTALFQETWRQGEVPQDFKDATIVHLYKRKGNRQVCDNHRGISLLNIAGKIFARILLNPLNNHLEQGLLPESQCGFRHHRGITDMIFAAR
nr:unnamed protein product [Spirometra erinaceieuropaei]